MIPRIQSIEFGRIRVDNKIIGNEKDIVLFWDKFYTKLKSHTITRNDVEKLIMREPDILIFGSGFKGNVKISPDAKKVLNNNKINYNLIETPKALKKFKELSHQGKKVAAIIHTTC